MLVIGLTGSIGMGKSTTADLFEEQGIPIFDSDAYVHMLYSEGGAAVDIFRQDRILKKAVLKDKTTGNPYIDRATLRDLIYTDTQLKQKIEQIVHTLVRAGQDLFLTEAQQRKYPAALLDIPLLFETGAEARCDVVIVVTAPASIQKKRVLKRPNMTEERFKTILKNQMSDYEKRKRADYIINTALGISSARKQVRAILNELL
jgi:dephospho-CoA kinase